VGFYGREAELALLRDDLEIDVPKGEREFRAYYIAGRRGVGKSELLERVKPMAGKDTPFVSVTIREDSDATACLEDLERSVENSGQASLLDGRPSPGRFDRARHRFVDTVRHLLGQGAIMAIDEIQRGRGNGIVGGIARIAAVTAEIVPFMGALYALGALAVVERGYIDASLHEAEAINYAGGYPFSLELTDETDGAGAGAPRAQAAIPAWEPLHGPRDEVVLGARIAGDGTSLWDRTTPLRQGDAVARFTDGLL